MRNLQDILYKAGMTELYGTLDLKVHKLIFDSRQIEKGDVFVAIKGASIDGHQFIDKAIELGAYAVVCETLPKKVNENITYVVVKNTSEALGEMASNYFDNPSKELKLIGVTGTNGKTTTTTLLHSLVSDLGYVAGLISTVVNKIGKTEIPSTHTTPNPVALNQLLRNMVDAGCEYCFMEVSSHAIDQDRIAGLEFDIAGFTNITHDHIDYHKTFKAYIAAKKKFFDNLHSNAIAITNKDDKNGLVMVQNTHAKIKTYALKTLADYKVKVLENSFSGLVLSVNNQDVWTRLIGDFNAYNLALVYAIATELELDNIEILTGLSKLKSVDGRFQYFKSSKNIISIVDYAHTPDALKNVLQTIDSVRTKNEKVITVVGCGGDRDKEKRPVMAEIAAYNSDQTILTSDNPRTENPDSIIKEMQVGVPAERTAKVMSITERQEAIKVACALANEGDIILIAGKGHEKYQDINGEKHPFDDFEIVKQTLKNLNK
ncbi:MAG: UDP-N-acetylmuramoyl-L-alanyl-D-glutamate--2,6-diaminopimelate ligase [Putridiphycobacter sp.]